MSFDYDLFVIGGGSGGVRAARVAAATGAKVALAEEYRMGGTCVIRGCVPKKLMVFASEFPSAIEDAQAYGWDVSSGDFDWTDFRTKMHAELDRLEGIYRRLLDGSSVTAYDTRATIKDEHTVTLSTGEDITAKHILIAVGGRPVKPDLANADLGITSNEIFLLEDLPKSILIIGGGYIACEFAGILNGLGVEVTQYYRGAQILRGFDDEARGLIADQMRDKGVNLHCGTNILEMERRDGKIWTKATNGTEATFEQVMFATGRIPNVEGLGLENVGVNVGRRGEIIVDEYNQTNVPSIYAVGDVTDRVQLTPVAIREAMAFVETVFKGNPTPVDHELIPSAVFTQPEYGAVGLTEEQARDQEPIEVYTSSFRPMQTLFAGREDRVLMKLIVSQATRKVLGVHIVAPQAGEMIQMVGIAVKMGATKEDFDRVCAVHPTMAEELVTMKTPTRTA
ncbi:glutathione-disulfide reductase [Marivivens donghaensis]|uniref:glutathione-disulfide reductase n=1 Tax=Marivivens donghaensis TaxID=1699413 RepID=UPI00201EA80F|nr:glutathione-disulfide reductase [Marivivens donghaensis]MCL7408335.1 glutathione-disulfide reductase [Marivivens donghaensis]MDN3704894.1 glutathione-disulfide reductase [Marivivens donghaensis]